MRYGACYYFGATFLGWWAVRFYCLWVRRASVWEQIAFIGQVVGQKCWYCGNAKGSAVRWLCAVGVLRRGEASFGKRGSSASLVGKLFVWDVLRGQNKILASAKMKR